MLSKKMEEALNRQIESESMSSQLYLAMASWADTQGFSGSAKFLYSHSDEERQHMLKLFQYINERSGHGVVSALQQPPKSFSSIPDIFHQILKHEMVVSSEINKLVDLSLGEKDYTTNNFLQWYISEQVEEERLAKTIVDKLNLIGNDKGGLYMFDRDLGNLPVGGGK